MIQVKTLGAIGIRKDGEELTGISNHKQKFALLAYLALEGPVGRDRLVAVFWPEREEEKARHSLSQAMYALRRELGEECLTVDGDAVTVTDESCAIDVRRLDGAAAAERWDEVLRLYDGPFLDQFVLPGTPEFESWQAMTRTRLARLARRAFQRVVEQQLADGDLASALATATRWTNLDPLEDEAHHALILLLAKSGDRVGALEHFEFYRERLRQELDVEPLEGTVSLVAAIRAGDVPEFQPLSSTEPAGQVAADLVKESPADYGATAAAGPTLLEELGKRRMFHIGAAYLAVAWLGIQLFDTLVDRAILPDWVFPATLSILAVGLPIALILAWVQEAVPDAIHVAGPARAHGPWRRLAQQVRGSHVLGFLGVLVIGLLAGLYAVRSGLLSVAGLREDRVMIFPLVVEPAGNETAGEEVAINIGHTIQSTGLYKWVDGWYGLNELQRAGVEELTPRTALEQTRDENAAFYVRGRVTLERDSVHVRAELRSAADNSILAYGSSSGRVDPFWVTEHSESVASQLLAMLVPDQQPIELASASSDTAQAVAEFLKGEIAYRKAHFEEALDHYEAAVALDSAYALAALKGALAASWQYELEHAEQLVAVATRRQIFLEPSTAQFAQGLADYYDGRADQAIGHFRNALAIDPDWQEAWAQLGETYTHFLPRAGSLDSIAATAFNEARRRQIEFRPVLYHLIQFAARQSDVPTAERLLAEYTASEPDSTYVTASRLTVECAASSAHVIDWRTAVETDPLAVHWTAQSLAKAGLRTDCARAGWTALLEHATPGAAGENYRFGALMALHSLLSAEGRREDIESLWAGQTEFADYAGDLLLLAANAGVPLDSRAEAYAGELRAAMPSGELASYEIWMLGVWEQENGRAESVRLLADTLAARFVQSGARLDRLMADVMEARAVLAAGDTMTALDLFRLLAPNKRRSEIWYPWETLAAETVTFARLLHARGQYAEAARVASSLDAPARPAVDLMYLPASLAIRARAARALGDEELERRSRERLANLGRTDLIETLDR